MSDRVVLARKGQSSMVKLRWTDAAPGPLNDVEDAEEMGAKWEGDELVTYDMPGFLEAYRYYEDNDYTIDND
jgi:predicted alpha/beta-fold hydrolase